MQLTNTTDYAIRMVVHLAAQRRVVSSAEIARTMGIPVDYLKVVSAPLRAAGIIASRKGVRGGYVLSKPPENITLLDIIELTEGTTKINRCLEHDRYCSRFATETCPVRACYVQLQTIVEYGLRSVTIGRLIGAEGQGGRVETGE